MSGSIPDDPAINFPGSGRESMIAEAPFTIVTAAFTVSGSEAIAAASVSHSPGRRRSSLSILMPGSGGDRSRFIRGGISADDARGTATSASWNAK
jgi:hypothetical protein